MKKAVIDYTYIKPLKSAYVVGLIALFITITLEPLEIEDNYYISLKTVLALNSALFIFLSYRICIGLRNYMIKNIIADTNWKNWHEGIFFMTLVTLGGISLYVSLLLIYKYFNVHVLTSVLFNESMQISLALGVTIFSFLKVMDYMFYFKNRLLDKENTLPQPIFKSESIIRIYSKNKTDGVHIYKIDAILLVESNDKELSVLYKADNGQIKKVIFRQSLRELEKQFEKLEFNPFYRCHKSFIVNTLNVKKLIGTSRQATLVIKDNIYVPVSRKKYKELRGVLTA